MNKKPDLRIQTLLLNTLFALALVLSTSSASIQAAAQDALPTPNPITPSALNRTFNRHSIAGGDFLVSTPGRLSPASVAIAYNPDGDQFLVVATTYQGVLAQIYASDGVPKGSAIRVSATPYVENPDVAYSTTRHEYMLVWGQVGGTTQEHIYGQRLNQLGVLQGSIFPVSTMPADKDRPAIAYNPFDDEYLVVWWQIDSIYGQRVDGDGYLLDNPNTPADEHDPAISFPISTANGVQDEPDVIYNPDDVEYLVVWQDDRSLSHDGIYGQRVDANGDLLEYPANTNFIIHQLAAYDAHKPVGAYNTHLNQYLIVWSQTSSTFTTITGDRLNRMGVPLDDPNTSPGDESLPNISIGVVPIQGYALSPALVYNAERQEYLITFTYSEIENDSANRRILAARLNESGRSKSPYDFPVSTSLAANPPALAYSSTSGQYLVAWPRYNTSTEQTDRILAQRVWWPSLLLGHEFNALPALDDQVKPAAAYNSRDHESLIVWEDWRDGNANIYGQRYDRDGLAIGENFLISTDTDNDLDPSIAYSLQENRYLVAWESGNHRYLRYRLVTAQGSFPDYVRGYDSQIDNTIHDPVVEYISDTADNSFIIAYTQNVLPGDSKIAARRLFPNGSCQDMVLTGNEKAQYPDLAYNAADNHIYLAYTNNTLGHADDIWQRIIEPDGTLVDDAYVVSETDAQTHPSVAWNADDNQYLVAWYDYRNSGVDGADIYAQRIASDGAHVGSNFKVSTITGVSNQQYPQVIYAEDLDSYRLVWQDDRTGNYDIRGNWVKRDGTVLHTIDDPIITYDGYQENPTLIYIPTYQRALVAWQDGRSTEEYDIYASFGAIDLTAPVARFTRDPIWGRTGDTFTFNAWPSRDDSTPRGSLLVRWDLTSDGIWDTPLGRDKYITQTIMTAAAYTITLEVWDRAFNTSQIKQKIVVLPSTSLDPSLAPFAPASQPPTVTFTLTPTFAVAGSTFQFDGRDSVGTSALQGRWDWQNDGVFDTAFTNLLTATHVYTVSNDYAVRFEVFDQTTGLSAAAIRTLKVLPGPAVSLEILPNETALFPNESLLWRFEALDIYNNTIYGPPLTWSLLNPLVGQISASGTFTASLNYGQYNGVIQASTGSVNDTASVLIYAQQKIYLPLIRR